MVVVHRIQTSFPRSGQKNTPFDDQNRTACALFVPDTCNIRACRSDISITLVIDHSSSDDITLIALIDKLNDQ